MLGRPYVVKVGDTLWGIAAKEMGDPTRWPELHEHNNTKSVTVVTGTKIVDPNLIFVGQKIYIPVAKKFPGVKKNISKPKVSIPSAKPIPNNGKGVASKKVRNIPFKYDLNKLPSATVVSPTHIATVTLKGSVTLQAIYSIDYATLTKQGFELKAKREADHAFGKLVTETQIGYNASTNEITFESGITTHSNCTCAPTMKSAAGISSKTGLPVIKGSITVSEIKGKVDKYFYVANSLGIEIEITPRPPSAKPKPVSVPKAKRVPHAKSGWDYLWGSLLVVGAGVIVVATITEDIVTFGAGVVDDAPSFAAAAAMFAGGISLSKTVNGGKPIQIEGHGVSPNQL